MQFLSTFRTTWWLRMSKPFNKEAIRCLGGFFEEIKAVCAGKMNQIQTEIEKNTKKCRFLKILCKFCVLFERFGASKNNEFQQGTNCCPGGFFEEINANWC